MKRNCRLYGFVVAMKDVAVIVFNGIRVQDAYSLYFFFLFLGIVLGLRRRKVDK